MHDHTLDHAGAAGAAAWSHEHVAKLLAFARSGHSAEDVSLRLARPLAEIRAKAAELGVVLKPRL